jgi:hypothetical protein
VPFPNITAGLALADGLQAGRVEFLPYRWNNYHWTEPLLSTIRGFNHRKKASEGQQGRSSFGIRARTPRPRHENCKPVRGPQSIAVNPWEQSNTTILAGDIGGTKTIIAHYERSQGNLREVRVATFQSKEHSTPRSRLLGAE